MEATDTECSLSGTENSTGANAFVITNNGSKVTEFYVYGEGDRVMGEVKYVYPGLQRKLIVQLTSRDLPDSVQARHDRRRHPQRLHRQRRTGVQIDTEGKFKEASDNYKRYIVGSQTDALVPAVEAFTAAIKAGDIEGTRRHNSGPTSVYYERIELVAESFPDDLDPRIDLREADLEEDQKWTGFHRLKKPCGSTGHNRTPT